MKYLRLENGICEKHDPIEFNWDKIPKENNEFKIIENASNKPKEEIYKAMMWADEIWFQSTFIYLDQIYGMGKLLLKLPSKVVKIQNLSSKTILYHIEDLFSLEESATLDKHKIYQINFLEDDILIDLSCFRAEIDEQERLKKEHYDNLLPTGRKVIIGNVQTVGKEWSLLKEGDVVDEIDNSEQDPSPGRGIWVRGLTEPVKLLNEDQRQEFTFETISAMALAIEFASFKGTKVNSDVIELLMWRINSIKSEIEHETCTLWDFCTQVCDYLKIERRYYRYFIEQKMIKYHEKYNFFAEYDRKTRLFKHNAITA